MTSNTSVQISRESLKESDNGAAIIQDAKNLASYSWIEGSVPTIAIPGAPPRWSPPAAPRPLQKDSGLVYIAQNAARHPEFPLEPLFRSLYVTSPEFDVCPVDIITDRNNIRKLLRFIDPSSSRDSLESFAINAEAIGNTTILSRVETKTSEIIGPHEFKGFGHEFEKTYTRCQISDSTGYHRIISYRFGGLNFIIRHEVDGYVSQAAASTTNRTGTEAEGLAGLLGSLTLSASSHLAPETNAFRPPGSKMIIRKEGITVPLDSILEIKTRVSHKRLDIHEIAPQLWASQTLKLVRAYHSRGLFQEAKVEDVSKEIKSWELANQKHLKRLVALIKTIGNAVRGCGGKAAIRYDRATDKITVSPIIGTKWSLPQDLYSKWGHGGHTAAVRGVKVPARQVSRHSGVGKVGTETDQGKA